MLSFPETIYVNQPSSWGDPAVIASLIASATALGIAIWTNWRNNRLRDEDRKATELMEKRRGERGDLLIASKVDCITMLPQDADGRFIVAIVNHSAERISKLRLWTIAGSATFNPLKKDDLAAVDLDLADLTQSQWKEMEFYFDNGASQVSPGNAAIFECLSNSRVAPHEQMAFSYIVPSGRAYAYISGSLTRWPREDVRISGPIEIHNWEK